MPIGQKKTPARGLARQLKHWLIPQRSNNFRPQLLHPETLLITAMVMVGGFAMLQTFKFFPSLSHSVLGFNSTITVNEVVEQTNVERANLGLKPLILNEQLSAAALAKAQDMLDSQYWAHTSPTGKEPWDFIKAANYNYQVAGENLARDFHGTPEMVAAWMASPTHQANIVNGRYEQIGVAVVSGQLEGFETTLVVQMFGTLQTGQARIGDQAVSQNNRPVFAVESSPANETGVSGAARPAVLSWALVPIGHLSDSNLFSPLQLTKFFFLGLIILIIVSLISDSLLIGQRQNLRLVGHNLGHLILFACVAFLTVVFKGGMIK